MRRSKAIYIRASIAGGISLSHLIAGLSISIFFSRHLGPVDFGYFVGCQSLAMLVAAFARFGLPEYYMRVAPTQISNIPLWGKMVAILIGLTIISLVFVGWPLASLLEDRPRIAFMTLGLAITFLAAYTPLAARGLHAIDKPNLSLFLSTALPGITTIAIYLGLPAISPDPLVAALACSTLGLGVSAILITVALMFMRPAAGMGHKTPTSAEIVKYAFPLGIIACLGIVNAQIDQVMLVVFGHASEAGYYRVAAQIALTLAVIHRAIEGLVIHRIPALADQGNWQEIRRITVPVARASTLLSIAALLAFAILGKQIVVYIYGVEYSSTYLVGLILILTQVVIHACGSVGYCLNFSGYGYETMKVSIIASLINVMLNLALIPDHGALGAAVSFFITSAFWNISLNLKVRRLIGIKIDVFSR